MHGKWIAVIAAWLGAGAASVGTAAAWGTDGRGTTLVVTIVAFVPAMIFSCVTAEAEKPGKPDPRG